MRPVTLVDGLGPIAAASVATVLFEATVTSTAEVPALLAHDGATNNGIAISIHRHRLPPRTLIQSRSTQLSAHLTSPGTTRSASSTLSVPLGRQVRQKVGAVLRRSISAGMGRIHNDREAPTSALGSLGHLAHRHERQHNAVADERTPNQLGFSPLDELGGNVGRRRCPPRSGRAGVPARSQVCEEGLELLVGLEDVGSPLFGRLHRLHTLGRGKLLDRRRTSRADPNGSRFRCHVVGAIVRAPAPATKATRQRTEVVIDREIANGLLTELRKTGRNTARHAGPLPRETPAQTSFPITRHHEKNGK